ncbi:MAG: ABC transporter ATP-binding protein, partial [Pseudomonadota bacterium]
DLDIETLDLLQEVLDAYDGTVLLVSHDRDFLDRVATTTVVLDGTGHAVVYAGGWSDMVAQRGDGSSREADGRSRKAKPTRAAVPARGEASDAPSDAEARQKPKGLSFTEQHRLAALPDEIARLEAEITKLEGYLGDPELYQTAPVKFQKATEALVARQEALNAAEEDWLSLAERAENAQY